jgi:hypothetical protein
MDNVHKHNNCITICNGSSVRLFGGPSSNQGRHYFIVRLAVYLSTSRDKLELIRQMCDLLN